MVRTLLSRSWMAGAAVAVLVLLLAPAVASAHGKLYRTQPKAGATVEKAPGRVLLMFANEVFEPRVRVLDLAGRRVATEPMKHDGFLVRLPLRGIDRGSYVVSWTVEDDHGTPLRGAYLFHVGEPTSELAGASNLPPQRAGAVGLRELSDLGRVGVVVAALGLLLAALIALATRRPQTRARALWAGVGAGGVLALWSLLGLASSAGLASGTPGLFDTGLADVGDLLSGTFGRLLAALLMLSLLIAASWRLLSRRSTMGTALLSVAAFGPVLLALGVALSERPEAKPTIVERSAALPDGRTVQVRVEPGLAGANDLTVDVFDAGGRPDAEVRTVDARLIHRPSDTGPYEVALSQAGEGHFVLPAGTIPFRGRWRFEVYVSRDKFDRQRVAFDAEVTENETLDRWLTSTAAAEES
jgi:methionine-rich copper-binding protein CopC